MKPYCRAVIGPERIDHLIEIATRNSHWHREKYKETGDRRYLGQWQAYRRVAKKLSNLDEMRQRNGN